jgi:hypothetical protein
VPRYDRMTVRQAFYALEVARVVEKTEGGYRQVQRQWLPMRRAGLLDWDFITDGTRWQRKPESWSSVDVYVEAFTRGYRRDLWRSQGARIEVCAACGRHFAAGGAFDLHRQGDHADGTRRCVSPLDEPRLVSVASDGCCAISGKHDAEPRTLEPVTVSPPTGPTPSARPTPRSRHRATSARRLFRTNRRAPRTIRPPTPTKTSAQRVGQTWGSDWANPGANPGCREAEAPAARSTPV